MGNWQPAPWPGIQGGAARDGPDPQRLESRRGGQPTVLRTDMTSRPGRRFRSSFSYVLLCVGVASLSGPSSRAAPPKFFDDDPIWQEPITQDVKNATRYEPDLMFQSLENLFAKPGDKGLGQRAKKINTIDEVPDGNFFVNRAGRMPLTPAIVARASNVGNGPAPGKWLVVSAKS